MRKWIGCDEALEERKGRFRCEVKAVEEGVGTQGKRDPRGREASLEWRFTRRHLDPEPSSRPVSHIGDREACAAERIR